MIGYYFTLPSLSNTSGMSSLDYYPYSYNTQSALISDRTKELMPQAIVFIAMGELSRESLVHDAISAVRLVGHWNEKIIILTDRPTCFHEYTSSVNSNTMTVTVEPKSNIIEIKKMKAEIFRYLPMEIDKVLYMDVDILITRNIGFFLQDLTHLLFLYQQQQYQSSHSPHQGTVLPVTMDQRRKLVSSTPIGNISSNAGAIGVSGSVATTKTTAAATATTPKIRGATSTSPTALPKNPRNNTSSLPLSKEAVKSSPNLTKETKQSTKFDFAAFLDAGGHYVGFCNGCEKWHTGVMYLRRNHGVECLKAWGDILSSGKFNTDQQSLDYAEQQGNCTNNVAIPSRHLLFAKDYIGMVLTSGQTFIHLTAANRAETQDLFYTEYIIPRIRNSLHPPLKPYNANAPKKTCK
jgi:hypothetical protein